MAPHRFTPSTTRTLRRGVVCTAAALLLASVLAACGSSSDGDSGDKITIGKAVDTIGYSVIDIAIEEGYFEDAGLDVEVVVLNGSTVANGALESGDIQFAGYSSLPLLQAREKGADVISVASFDYGVPLQLVAGGSYAAKIDANAELTDRVKTLEGAKIGFVSSTDGGFIDLLLERAGLPADAVEKVSFNNVQAAVAAIEDGQIDAAIGSPPSTIAALEGGELATVASLREVPEYAEMTYDLLNTTAEYAKENADTVSAVATALAKANNYVNDPANKSALNDFETAHFSGFSPEALDTSVGLATYSTDGLQTQEHWDNAVETFKEGGLIEGDPAVESETWTNEYVDVDQLG